MTQERIEVGQDSTPYHQTEIQRPDIKAALSKANTLTNKIRVVSGANEQYFDTLEGKTVGSVRKSLRKLFNISDNAEARIGDKAVNDDFILESGAVLEFVKDSGVKG